MAPSLSFLDSFNEKKNGNVVYYLVYMQDKGSKGSNLSEYIDADILSRICKNCRRRRSIRTRRVRAYRRA